MCPCELEAYDIFRSGYTFLDVRQMLWSYSDDSRDWPNVSRHTVLGYWRQLKLELWEHYGTFTCTCTEIQGAADYEYISNSV